MEKLTNEQLIECFEYIKEQLNNPSTHVGICTLICNWVANNSDTEFPNRVLCKENFKVFYNHKPTNASLWWFPRGVNEPRIAIVEKILTELREKT